MKGDAAITRSRNRSGSVQHEEGEVTSETVEVMGEKPKTIPKDETIIGWAVELLDIAV